MGWMNSILDTASKAFSWLDKNPTATSFIGGAAMAGLSYMKSSREAKDARKQYERQRKDAMILPSSPGDKYGTIAGMDMSTLPGTTMPPVTVLDRDKRMGDY